LKLVIHRVGAIVIYYLLRRCTPFLKVGAAFYSETLVSVRNVTWLTACTTTVSPLDYISITVNPSSQWTDRVTTVVLQRAEEVGNIVRTAKGRKANWIGQSAWEPPYKTHY